MSDHDEAVGVLDALSGETHWRWGIQKSGKLWRVALFAYRGIARYDVTRVHETLTVMSDGHQLLPRRAARRVVARANKRAVSVKRVLRPKFIITQ